MQDAYEKAKRSQSHRVSEHRSDAWSRAQPISPTLRTQSVFLNLKYKLLQKYGVQKDKPLAKAAVWRVGLTRIGDLSRRPQALKFCDKRRRAMMWRRRARRWRCRHVAAIDGERTPEKRRCWPDKECGQAGLAALLAPSMQFGQRRKWRHVAEIDGWRNPAKRSCARDKKCGITGS